MNKYAAKLLEACRVKDESRAVDQLDRSIGKMDNSLFDLMLDLAKRLDKKRPRNAREPLKIRDASEPEDQRANIGLLRQVNFEGRNVAAAIKEIYSESSKSDQKEAKNFNERLKELEQFLDQRFTNPCLSLIERLDVSKVSLEELQVKSKQSLNVSLQFEVVRLCHRFLFERESIWRLLA